jgi:hypothetical protein
VDDSSGHDIRTTSLAIRELVEEYAHSSAAPSLFFNAWRRGVQLAGPNLFGSGPATHVDQVTTLQDLCPKLALIERAIGAMSSGEQVFLAALVSIYNADEGTRLFERIGLRGLADFGGLDLPRRAVIASLILNYAGW